MSDIRRIPFSLLQKCEEQYYKQYPSLGNVLMFHQVNDDYSSWEDTGCSITNKSFYEIIKSASNFVNMTAILECKENKRNHITFDDAYDDVYKFAFPILEQRNISFTVFVAPSLLGCKKYLTINHLKELSRSPLCTIGAHSVSHKMLRFLSDQDAKNEIEHSKLILENIVSKGVEYFAFPYGSRFACSLSNIENVEKAGFKAAFSTINCSLNNKMLKNKYFLPRRNVNEKNYLEIIRLVTNEKD